MSPVGVHGAYWRLSHFAVSADDPALASRLRRYMFNCIVCMWYADTGGCERSFQLHGKLPLLIFFLPSLPTQRRCKPIETQSQAHCWLVWIGPEAHNELTHHILLFALVSDFYKSLQLTRRAFLRQIYRQPLLMIIIITSDTGITTACLIVIRVIKRALNTFQVWNACNYEIH